MWDDTYRPKRFSDVLGQEGSIKVLKSRLANGTGLETSYLFSGGHGQGKTTLARILARALLCEQLRDNFDPCNECDNCKGILNETSEAFVEQDAASRGTVDNMRAIVDDLPFMVQGASKRIFLFDEAHRMSKDAQDVLLKPLEEGKMVGMFCTTEPEKIRGPIRSRCEDYSIRKVDREVIAARMKMILDTEKVPYEDDAVLTVVDHSAGHVRDIIKKLEMIAQMGSVTVAAVRDHLNLGVITRYYEILLALGTPQQVVPLVEQVCDRVGPDETATGIAEAAMNAYRLAHGLHTDFALVDRGLAEQVYKLYQESTVQLANYFLQSYKPTRVGLVCDVIRCAKGVPAPATGTNTSPPVAVMAVVSAAPVQHALPKPVSEQSVESTPAPVATAAPVVSVQESPKPTALSGSGTRSDGIGSLGSSDLGALTELDHKVVRTDLPRGAVRKTEIKPNGRAEGAPLVELLPSTQWASEFADGWQTSHNGGA